MSLRVKLTLFMLVASLFPMLLYAGNAYRSIRDRGLQQAMDTSAALFDAKLENYEQKVQRLYNTSIDIISSSSLRYLFRAIHESEDMSARTVFRKSRVVTNSKAVQHALDAHLAAQRDLLNGIGLIRVGSKYMSLSAGNLRISQPALTDSLQHVGVPRLVLSLDSGKPMYAICLSFTDTDPSVILGTCALDLRDDSLFETLMPAALSENEQLFVLDGAGRLAFHPDAARIGTAYRDTGLLKGVAESTGRSYLAELDGQSFIVNCKTTATNPDWTVYYAVPYEFFVQSSSGMAGLLLPFALLCALMAIAAALLFSWNVYAPIRRLTSAISGMTGRNLKPIRPHSSMPEIALLADSFNALVHDVNKLLHQVEVEADHAKRAEIIALRAQVSPHFLYNTLNVIKCLAAQNRTGEIEIATTNLIDLLRASIGDAREVVPLRTELGYVDNYILLQRYRLDLRFRYETQIDADVADWSVPHFMLQPIVENALIHAFGQIDSDQNLISVRARAEDDRLVLEVEDTGDGIDRDLAAKLNEEFLFPASHWMSKVGLHNVCERAHRQLGPTARLTIHNTGAGTLVRVTLPAVPYPKTQTTSI